MTILGCITPESLPPAPVLAPASTAHPKAAALIVRRPPRRRRRDPFYALAATQHEITLPRVRPLGYLTQSRLIQRAQRGDTDARNTVWLHNARLAYTVLNRHPTRPHLMADAFQEAQLGLPRAIRRFDVGRLLEFSTYTFAVMRRAVGRHRPLAACAAHAPASVIASYLEFRSTVAQAHSRADWFDAREWYLARFPALYHRLLGLHALAEPRPLEDARGVPAEIDPPDTRLLGIDLAGDFVDALARLEPRQLFIIRRRYGLDGRKVRTLDKIGARLGLTKERVRQIQDKALATMRNHLTDRGWDHGLVPLASLS